MKCNNNLLVVVIIAIGSICTGVAQDVSAEIIPAVFISGLGKMPGVFVCCVSPNTVSVSTINFIVDELQENAPEVTSRGISATRVNQTTSELRIDPTIRNNFTNVICQVVLIPLMVTKSQATFFVQGIVSSINDLQIMPTPIRPSINSLFWTPPFTLDITNTQPDITYRVCLLYLDAQTLCTMTEDPSHEFSNVGIPQEFLVTAINIVGENAVSSISFPACMADNLGPFGTSGPFDVDLVNLVVTNSPPDNFSVEVIYKQPPQRRCYDLHIVQITTTSSGSQSNLIGQRYGPFFPVLVDARVQLLELARVGNLAVNKIYTLQIITINTDGMTMADRATHFGTYDVQGVTLSAQGLSLRLGCSFLRSSLAFGCRVTVCQRREEGNVVSCRNVTLERASPSGVFRVDEKGTYVVTAVADVEQNNVVTNINDISIFGALEATITLGVGVTTLSSAPTPNGGGSGVKPGGGSGIGIGPLVGGVGGAVVLVVIVIAIGFLVWRSRKNQRDDSEDEDYNEDERELSWSESISRSTDESYPGSHGMPASRHSSQSRIATRESTGYPYRPTSPVYTDGRRREEYSTPTPYYYQQDGITTETSPPVLPPKTRKSPQRCSNASSIDPTHVIPPPPEYRDSRQHLSQDLTSPNNTLGLPSALVSQESLHSQVSGNVTYAELEHHEKKPRRIRDKTSVLYSEIKVEEIAPVLPQKKSLKGRAEGDGGINTAVEQMQEAN